MEVLHGHLIYRHHRQHKLKSGWPILQVLFWINCILQNKYAIKVSTGLSKYECSSEAMPRNIRTGGLSFFSCDGSEDVGSEIWEQPHQALPQNLKKGLQKYVM